MNKQIDAVLTKAVEKLTDKLIASPLLDAQLLLAQVLNKPRSYLYAWPDKSITSDQFNQFEQLLKRRLTDEPLAYILGVKSFWDLELKVTPDVLIPRPETELMIELVLNQFNSEEKLNVIDLGTGSGAIAAAIGSEYPTWKILATDFSSKSLDIAKQNFKHLKLTHIETKQADWLHDFKSYSFPKPDLILTNPPYIKENDPYLKKDGLFFEPQQALVSGNDGLVDIRQISQQAATILKPRGWLFLEHGYQQAKAVRQILANNQFQHIQTWQDLAGLERITAGCISL